MGVSAARGKAAHPKILEWTTVANGETMPSGKKARGRKNRAKKEATLAARQRTLWEPMVLGKNAATIPCEHMLLALPQIPQEGPAVSFMNCLASGAESFSDVDPRELCFLALSKFPVVMVEEGERSLVIDLLLRFLRNAFVQCSMINGEKWLYQKPANELMICSMINVLELLRTYSDITVVNWRAAKINNRLAGGNRRDLLKFVAKRLPCTCLKKLHSAARKKVEKVGICHGCTKRFPVSQLYVCTGCMLAAEYCSPACQRANWSLHKQYCGDPELISRDLPATTSSKGTDEVMVKYTS